MNFLEYVRFSLWHLWATGQPLDQKSVTLSGSLGAGGLVLSGDWRDDGFCVYDRSRRGSGDGIRARQVVPPSLA